MVYNKQLQDEQKATFFQNQQILELLLENSNLKNKLGIKQNNSNFSAEKKRVEEVVANYDSRYNTLREGVKIILSSSVLFVFAILLLWFLIRYWVVHPINKLSDISNIVATGNLKIRLLKKKKTFFDELDILANTFNQMLENLENNIQLIKNNAIFLQSLIDNIPDGIRVIDEEYNVILANKAYYNLVCTKHLKNRKCYKDAQGFDAPCPKHLFDCPLQSIKNENLNNYKVIQHFGGNSNKHLSINAAPLFIKDFNNDKFCIVESIRDLSDDIQFSHQQKLSSLGFLATSVAHEMKNHLGSIKMITEALIDKYHKNKPKNEETEFLEMMYKQIVECSLVPERLLRLSQTSEIDLKPLDIKKNTLEVIALMDYEAKKNGSVIKIDLEDDLFIKGFEADFKMIVINLCLNAFKAMKNDGIVTISSKTKGRSVVFKVADNGIGIPKDRISRIFEPFYSSQPDASKKGTGLGLSIVKSIVENFGGKISVKSKPNVGTSFELTFKKIKV